MFLCAFLAKEAIPRGGDAEQFQKSSRETAGFFDVAPHGKNGVTNSRIAFFFYGICLETARMSKSTIVEMTTHYDLGRMAREMSEIVRSIQHFERYMELARSLDIASDKEQAGKELCESIRKCKGHQG